MYLQDGSVNGEKDTNISKNIDLITNKKLREILEERINKKFTENEITLLKETEMDIVGAFKTEIAKYSNGNERVWLEEKSDTLLYVYPIVIDWHIYLGIQACKESWESGRWNEFGKYTAIIEDHMCDIYDADKSDKLQRTICCSVEYPWKKKYSWSDKYVNKSYISNKIMSPAEKKYHIENSMSEFE